MADLPQTDVLPERAAPSLRLILRVMAGPDQGKELRLERGSYRVGKGATCDLLLSDSSVSRVHLIVEVLEGATRLIDNESTNGSLCDGHRFQTLDARPGAQIEIGRTTLELIAPILETSLAPSERSTFGRLVGNSRKMREVFALLERAAASDIDVLLTGESGTGKELCAEALHAQSKRAGEPLVICDLAGISPTLFESELFGHAKGAFTGAQGERAGAFERAHKGTLFLDEIGELPIDLQPRLLRALEQRETKRVGANAYHRFDVRVIAATHRVLSQDVKDGRFREDLYHRLAVLQVNLPPLRERREDLFPIVDALLESLGQGPEVLTPQTRALISAYHWPGNARELRNVITRAVSLGLPPALPAEGVDVAATLPAAAESELPFKEAKDRLVTAFERDYLKHLLARCDGNVSRAAREAQIDRVYLHRMLKKHGLTG